jgi:general secretion pathway protein D
MSKKGHEMKLRQIAFNQMVVVLGVAGFTLNLTSCAFAPWKESATYSSPETRVAEVTEELKKNPEDTKTKKDFYLNKESATLELLTQAEEARYKGDMEAAARFYARVLSFSPDNANALAGREALAQELEQNKQLEKAKELLTQNQLKEAQVVVRHLLLENPQQKIALQLKAQIDEKIGRADLSPPELKPTFKKPVTLEFTNANINVVFNALSRATGINFILDKDIKSNTKASIFVKDLPIEQAIDMVLASNNLQKKVLSENTVLVYPSNQRKLKSYQELMIRSFFFTNTSAKQAALLLKTMLKTKDIFVDDRLNMLVMRDTPEAVRIAEKLITANDLEDPEVMLDIEVLEVSRNRLQELGIVYPNQLAVLSADTGLTLDALKNLTSETTGVSPNPAINFKKTTGDVNLLSNPRIRVKNNEQAKILVGDKVPIITTTSTANVGVSENVTYVDVGLKLDVEPRVTLDDFVNIKVGLEVSSLGDKTVTTNGATVYTIGTRNTSTVLRLKNGETQILAGLILDNERKNASKLPGLGDIPLIGRLFSNQEDQRSKTEIVLAITPRIIGNIPLPKAEFSEYWSGTEEVITDKPSTSLPVTGSINGSLTDSSDSLLEQKSERLQQTDADEQQEQPQQEQPQQESSSKEGEVREVVVPSEPAVKSLSSVPTYSPKPATEIPVQLDQ